MDKKELKKGIEEDPILGEMKETLKKTVETAKKIREEAVIRRYALLDKMDSPRLNSVGYYDNLDDLEKSIQNLESSESIALKTVALEELSRIPWKWDKNYQEAYKQYLVYLGPILKEIEDLQATHIKERAILKSKHEKELLENKKEIDFYDNLIKELMNVHEGLYADYKINNNWRVMTGYGRKKAHEYIQDLI